MKTILAIDQGQYLGGAERFLADLLSRYAERSDVHIHLITGDNLAYHQLYQRSRVQIHTLTLPALKPLRLSTLQNYLQTQKQLNSLVENIRPDLIVSNTVRTHLLISPVAATQKIPLVWMAHDLTFPKFLLKWFLKFPQHIIACSQFTADYYRSPQKTSVLYPFGIDPERFSRLEQTRRQAVVGMVGKFIPWKGHDLFIEAVHQLHQEFPNQRFVMVADAYRDNPESVRFEQQCRDMIQQYQLEGVLTIKAQISDLIDELAGWQILVHCSKDPEPLGRVILEGMASGCSVVASNHGGPQEMIDNQQTGILVPPSVESITTALRTLLNDEHLRQQLGKRAQEHIKGTFQWNQVLDHFDQLLKKT